MTVKHAIDYLSFVVLLCNGTSLIAEVASLCLGETKTEMRSTFQNRFKSNFYSFLCDVSKRITNGKAVGSCTEPRHSPTSQKGTRDYDSVRGVLLSKIKRHFFTPRSMEYSTSAVKKASLSFIDDISTDSKNFNGVGRFLCTQYLQCLSLIGIIPLACSDFAIPGETTFGSGEFIRLSKRMNRLSLERCKETFDELMNSVHDVWDDGKATCSVVENTLCELTRSYWQTAKAIVNKEKGNEDVTMNQLKKRRVDRLPDVRVVMNNKLRKESRTKDVYYHFAHRKQIQHFFKLRYSGGKNTKLRPTLMMMIPGKSVDEKQRNLKVTNFRKDAGDDGLCKWEHKGNSLTLGSKFSMTKAMRDEYTY